MKNISVNKEWQRAEIELVKAQARKLNAEAALMEKQLKDAR